MRIRHQQETTGTSAFTLIEVIVCMAIVGVVFVSLYGGMAFGYSTVALARENLRATQILVEKMEVIRLYNWDQITSGTNVPTTFTAAYYPDGTTNQQGVTYSGTVDISKYDLKNNYDNNMRLITVGLTWTTGNLERSRTLSTTYSRYGMQNYSY